MSEPRTTWVDLMIIDLECDKERLSDELERVTRSLTELQRPEIDRFTSRDPAVMSGALCIAGTRLTVDTILNVHEDGWDHARIHEAYPFVTMEIIERVLREYAD